MITQPVRIVMVESASSPDRSALAQSHSVNGQLRKVMVVIKMRGGNHSKDIREYVIADRGVVVIKPRSTDYEGLTTGTPTRTGPLRRGRGLRHP